VEQRGQPLGAEDEDVTVVSRELELGGFFADRYRIERLLGVGAMGKVFLATDTRHHLPVALKVLHPDKAQREQIVARFRREAEILAGIGHPGIVRFYECGTSAAGVDYIAMEVLEGRTLREHFKERAPMSPREMLPLIVAVADALGAAHTRGVVHRDLKPDNVFLQSSGVVKVMDFGLSLLDTDKRVTKTGVMLGTPRYMPPEQIRSARDVDPRGDIYALGIIAHEALTGASPFPAEDAAQLLGCVIEGRIIRLEDVRPDLPPGVGDVLRRAMAKDRGQRYATMSAFAESLARSIGVSVARARTAGRPMDESLPPPPRDAAEPDIPTPADPPRFTLPPDLPAHLAGTSPAPGAPTPPSKKASNAPLVIAAVLLALVALACVGAAVFALAFESFDARFGHVRPRDPSEVRATLGG
jgi:serine/threonine-protein kinase